MPKFCGFFANAQNDKVFMANVWDFSPYLKKAQNDKFKALFLFSKNLSECLKVFQKCFLKCLKWLKVLLKCLKIPFEMLLNDLKVFKMPLKCYKSAFKNLLNDF